MLYYAALCCTILYYSVLWNCVNDALRLSCGRGDHSNQVQGISSVCSVSTSAIYLTLFYRASKEPSRIFHN